MIRIGRLPGNYGTAGFLGFAFGLVIFIVLSKAMVESPWPISFSHYDQHLAGWLAIRLNSLVPEFFPDIASRYAAYLSALPGEYRPWHLLWRFDGPFFLATLVGVWITWVVGRGIPDTKITSGRILFEGKAAQRELKKRAKEDCSISGQGLKFHPSFLWSISRDRESRHLGVYGSIGGGKTVVIQSYLNAAIGRGDRVLLYDNKGDFTSSMDVPFVLLTPWDKRSMAWDISKDCTTKQDARELAARLIPESQDPMWSNAARQILSALILKLQNEQPEAWTWRDLFRLTCLPLEPLSAIVTTYAPEARSVETEGKTIDGILINLSAYMPLISDLADAWGDAPPEKRFAFSHWIHDPTPTRRVIIMQGSGRYQELTRGYVQSVISLLAGRINSAEIGESKSRRLWLFLDEFPQLGKLSGFSSILEVGRSKGVCVVLGAQDQAQIEELYGQYVAQSWGSMIGTQVIVRVNSGTTAEYLAKTVVGYANVEKTIIHDGKVQPPVSQPPQLVLEPSEISDYLGPTKTGIRAVLLGMGDAFLIEWPYTNTTKLREASIEAPWVRGGAKSNKQLPPLPTSTGAPTMTPMTVAQPSMESPSSGLPRLKLRAPTQEEIHEMAITGTDVRFAPEPLGEMQSGADIESGGEV